MVCLAHQMLCSRATLVCANPPQWNATILFWGPHFYLRFFDDQIDVHWNHRFAMCPSDAVFASFFYSPGLFRPVLHHYLIVLLYLASACIETGACGLCEHTLFVSVHISGSAGRRFLSFWHVHERLVFSGACGVGWRCAG